MLDAVDTLPLPTKDILDSIEHRKDQLDTLRTRALVHPLWATALRARDICAQLEQM